MRFPVEVFKIAAELIGNRLNQMAEPADLPRQHPQGKSALRLLGRNDHATATEPAPKVVTDCGYQVKG